MTTRDAARTITSAVMAGNHREAGESTEYRSQIIGLTGESSCQVFPAGEGLADMVPNE